MLNSCLELSANLVRALELAAFDHNNLVCAYDYSIFESLAER